MTKKTSQDTPQFILYPGLHKLFLDQTWNFNLPNLLSSIEAENLDAICVEISPNDFNNAFEGYYPPEAAAIAEFFNQTKAIIPADWRGQYNDYKKPSAETLSHIAVLKTELDNNLNEAPSRIEFIISSQGEAQIKKIHEIIINQDVQEADGFLDHSQ